MDSDFLHTVLSRNPRYFRVAMFIISIICFSANLQRQLFMVALYQPGYRCELPSNMTVNQTVLFSTDSCHYKLNNSGSTIKCSRFVFENSQYIVNYLMEFQLVCENGRLLELLYYFQAVNIPLMLAAGLVCDLIGRRLGLLVLLTCHSVTLVASTFADNKWTVALCLVLNKSSLITEHVGFVWLLEMLHTKLCPLALALYFVSSALVGLVVAFIGYYLVYWRFTLLIMDIVTLLWLLLLLLPESPRWLLTKNRYREFTCAMRFIADVNKVNKSDPSIDNFVQKLQWNSISTGALKEFVSFPHLLYRLALLSMMALLIDLTACTFSGNIVSLDDNYNLAKLKLIGIESTFLLLVWWIAFVKNFKNNLMYLLGLLNVVYFISLFLNSQFLTEKVVKVVMLVTGGILAHASKILLSFFTCSLMPTTNRCLAISVLLSCGLLGELLSTALNEFVYQLKSKLVHMHQGFHLPVVVSVGLLVVTMICFYAEAPTILKIPLPQLPSDANYIVRGSEAQLQQIYWKNEIAFNQKHELAPLLSYSLTG